jgi:hypothetical protein
VAGAGWLVAPPLASSTIGDARRRHEDGGDDARRRHEGGDDARRRYEGEGDARRRHEGEGDAPGSGSSQAPVTLRVHVHRVPTIPDRTFHRVVRAVDVGVEQVARTANARLDRRVDHAVAVGETAPGDRIVTATRDAVHDSTIDWLRDVDALVLDALHVILVDAPFSQSIGYGQNDAPLGAALGAGEPAVSYANVGATERWDDPVVTDNIAVHEVLHGLVTGREVEAVLGRRCEHDLGAVHHR